MKASFASPAHTFDTRRKGHRNRSKRRPGYVLMIDILAGSEAEVAGLLADELGIWGYRVLRIGPLRGEHR